MAFDIITCGSATLDVFVKTDNEQVTVTRHKKREKFLAYPAGGKLLINDLTFELGGGGTNTAVGFARQGFKTGYLGCLGNDETAIHIRNSLQKEKISFIGTHTKNTSGYSVILDSKQHDRTILTHKGSNDELRIKSVPAAKAYYFSSMLGESLKSQLKIAKAAKRRGAIVAYNPSLYQVKNPSILPLLRLVDILIFNKEEAAALTKKRSIMDMHRFLQERGIPLVIITDGPRSVTCSHQNVLLAFTPKKTLVVESTGAGDAFASGFVGVYIYTKNIAKALAAGQANAHSVLSSVGAKKGLLSRKKLLTASPQRLKSIHLSKRFV